MTDIDEAMLIAWVDGELDEVNRRRVDRAVADDPALAARLAKHSRLRMRVAEHYAPVAQEPVPHILQAMLEQQVQVVPIPRPARRWNWVMGGAIAASLVLGLGVGRLTGGFGNPVVVRGGSILAQGQLADALDSQLAATQGDAPVRIGLTFQRKGGGWCRSFDGVGIAGVACREGADWQVQAAVPGTGGGNGYRQAASGDARIMATIDTLINGAPVDADGEAAAQTRNWK